MMADDFNWLWGSNFFSCGVKDNLKYNLPIICLMKITEISQQFWEIQTALLGNKSEASLYLMKIANTPPSPPASFQKNYPAPLACPLYNLSYLPLFFVFCLFKSQFGCFYSKLTKIMKDKELKWLKEVWEENIAFYLY